MNFNFSAHFCKLKIVLHLDQTKCGKCFLKPVMNYFTYKSSMGMAKSEINSQK